MYSIYVSSTLTPQQVFYCQSPNHIFTATVTANNSHHPVHDPTSGNFVQLRFIIDGGVARVAAVVNTIIIIIINAVVVLTFFFECFSLDAVFKRTLWEIILSALNKVLGDGGLFAVIVRYYIEMF